MTEAPESNCNGMHIALICPFSSGPSRGNITTVRRIADNLTAAGCRITMVNLDTMSAEEQLAVLNQDRPALLHAFHAYHAGPTARLASRKLGITYLITITGSDLFDATICNAEETRTAILDAAAVTCFDPLVAQRLTKVFPHIAGKLTVIPQGVAPLPLQNPFPHPDDNFLILLPAALRPVKGVSNAIDALTPLALEFPSLRLIVVGGPLDPEYADIVHEMVGVLPWVQLFGDIPYHQMGALYSAADLVLNSSVFEGGMANALLEAMVMGRPVLARDILGNRSLISHGKTGWLYSNDDEMKEIVRMLILDPDHGAAVGEAGRCFVQKHCSPLTEAGSYAALYKRLLR